MNKKIFLIPLLTLVTSLSACGFLHTSDSGSGEDSSSSHKTPGDMHEKMRYTYLDYGEYNAYQTTYCPSLGNPKLLVIPVWFTDSGKYIVTSKKETVRSDIEKAFVGSPEDTGWHSVVSFYEEESKGKCNLSATVSEWYECGKASTQFYTSTQLTTDLVNVAANWYFDNHKEDSRKNYDSDSNGYLDGVILVYGSPDYVALNKNAANMWAYCFWVGMPNLFRNVNKPGADPYMWASYDFMYSSGKKAMSQTGYTYGSGDTAHCSIDAHTFIHETGHLFGLDDYYDYSSAGYKPAGSFSMQDFNIGGHDPFSVMALGWLDPIVPKNSCTIKLEPFQNNHDVVLLTNNFSGSTYDEYLLVEFYTPTGLNELDCTYSYGSMSKGPGISGIRLWHVDARLLYYVYNKTKNEWEIDYPNLGTELSKGNDSYCATAFSNTYNDPYYGCLFGQYNSKYYNYNLLQVIKNNTYETYKSKKNIADDDLFKVGDSFSLNKYQSQFVEYGTLNSGESLAWSFSVESTNGQNLTVKFTKS